MYLVHLSFLPPVRGRFSDKAKEMIRSVAAPGDGLEHITVHRRRGTDPVVGLFLRSRSLTEAENTASLLWHRAVEAHPELREYQLFRCEAPLVEDGCP